MFGVSLFFAPLVAAIPAAACAPALIIVGAMMSTPILKIDFDDYTELIPAFTVIARDEFHLQHRSRNHCGARSVSILQAGGGAMARNTCGTLDALRAIDTF